MNKPYKDLVTDSLTNEINSGMLTYQNHSNDNGFLYCDFDDFAKALEYSKYEPYGVCRNVPYNTYNDKMVAYAFKEHDEIRWIHMPEAQWRLLLSDIYGREKAKAYVNERIPMKEEQEDVQYGM